MRFPPLIFVLALFAGCARDDVRLQGTWHSDREATVTAAFQRDPWWKNVPPHRLALFRDMFGHLTITYSKGIMYVYLPVTLKNGTIQADNRSQVRSQPYRVVKKGPDYVVIRCDDIMDKGRDIRIRFVDGNAGYWIDMGPLGHGLEEKFDRINPTRTEGASPRL